MTTPDPRHHDPAGDLPDPAGEPETHPEHEKLMAERDALRTKVRGIEHTRTRATFFGLVIGAIILILLLVFILQNLRSEEIMLIFWEVNLPLGVSLLIAAIAGALITALAGGLRMLQMSRALKRARK
jgi:uncharacterized integral membrane protein